MGDISIRRVTKLEKQKQSTEKKGEKLKKEKGRRQMNKRER